ncbi:agenet-like domain, Agenet domain [Artemisia annua]|uniref:Agenet-like domain, Agenet domain n=1 Tax=Artemisia annua TaxID=35608 RepID=A0A2U1QBS2_ARTAN|nr:agenet-like domain, Agenet domain [Artemisia annua]
MNCSTEAGAAVSNLTDPTKDTTQGTDKETYFTTEERAALSLNSSETTKDTTTGTDKETYCSTEERAAVSLNSTDPIKDTKSDTDKASYCTTEVRAAVISSLTDPTTDSTSVTDKETHRSTELSAAATSSLKDLTEDKAPDTDKKTSIVTRSMKRQKPAGLRSNEKSVKPSKKLKVRITSDDQSPLEAGQSKEVSNTPVGPSGDVKKAKADGETIEATKNISDDQSPLDGGQSKEANKTPLYPSGRLKRAKVDGKTSATAKSISNGKKTPGKQEKAAELKSPVIKSARKKEEISADNKGQKTLPEGAEGDSTITTTPDIVEEQQVTQNWPIRVVMGLQCKAVTSLQSNKPKQLSSENEPLNPEAKTPQSFAPLSPKTTGNQKDTEATVDTTVRKKRGRPFKVKRQAKLPETPLAVSNENGDEISAAVAISKQENTATAGVVDGDKTLHRGSGIELALREDSCKTVKGKRGKRRSISGLETVAPAQGSQDSSVQKANGDLVEDSARQNSELHVDTISDDQPLSRWLQSSATVDNTGRLSGLVAPLAADARRLLT